MTVFSLAGKRLAYSWAMRLSRARIETKPNVKANAAQGYTKAMSLDCGALVNVLGFLDQGQKVKVDTEKGEYMRNFSKEGGGFEQDVLS